MIHTLRLFGFAVCLVLDACSVNPSRAPLGGNYDAPDAGTSADRHAPQKAKEANATSSEAPGAEGSEVNAPKAALAVAAVPVDAGAASASLADTLVYQPLKPGDQIKAEVTLAFSAELRGGPPGMLAGGKLGMDSKMRVELKVVKASTQSLDELELSVTTLSMHSEFGGKITDAKPEPPDVYDVTLSGQSPTIRNRNGSKQDAGDRAVLLILVAPLAEFHSHWARSPSLDLRPGWSSKVPVSVPSFADSGNETVHVGPLGVRYSGRDANGKSDLVPFELTLPIQYGADMGKLDFDLAGKAVSSKASGRPTSLELSGPFSAHGGPSGSQLSFSGSTKFTAALSYH
jgi:hypothetical protein